MSHAALQQKEEPHVPAATTGQWLTRFNFLLLSLAVVAVVFGVYATTLQYNFVLDDHRFTADPRVQSSGHIWEYFTDYVWAQFTGGPSSFYRPLFVLWMRVNFVINGMSPWGWHFLSIAKHLAVAALLGLLVWRLLGDRMAALLAATLFSLHPAHTECVSWSTVPDPLMAVGVLGTLLLYLRFAEEFSSAAGESPKKKLKNKGENEIVRKRIPQKAWLWLVASSLACFLALLTKETAIVLPVMIFVLTIFVVQRGSQISAVENGSRRIATRSLRVLGLNLPFACAVVVYLFLRFNAFGGTLGSLTQHLPWRTVIWSWPAILWFYVKALLWPVRSYAYADPILAEKFSVGGVLLPGLAVACFVAVLGLIVFRAWRKARRDFSGAEREGVQYALLIGVLLLVLPILPALNVNALNPGDFLHGRYVYLPCAGLMLVLATAWQVSGKRRALLLCAAGLLAAIFAGLTLSQERMWKDDLTIFTAGHELAPNNEWVFSNLEDAHVEEALATVQQGRCNEVLNVFERVTREYPANWHAWAGLGYCYFTLHDLPKAEESLHRAAQISKDARTVELWQELRKHMGLPPAAPLE